MRKALKYVLKFLMYTGLWVPLCYIILGVVFKFTNVLDPLHKTNINSMLYRIGFYISLGLAVFILFRHLFPFLFGKSKKKERKKETREAEKQRSALRKERKMAKAISRKERKSLKQEQQVEPVSVQPVPEPIRRPPPRNIQQPPITTYVATQEDNKIIYRPTKTLPPVPEYYLPPSMGREEPKIYMSKLEKDTLIHEYSDCFIVYKLQNGRAVKERIEYK